MEKLTKEEQERLGLYTGRSKPFGIIISFKWKPVSIGRTPLDLIILQRKKLR